MRLTAIILLLLFLLSAPAFPQDSHRDKYFATADAFIKKDYETALKLEKEILALPSVPMWIQIACYADMAAAYAQLNDVENSLAAFEKAVSLGYNDYIGLVEGGLLTPLFANPRFREAYSQMKVSPLEQAELEWIHREINAEIHDMNMIITENINRKDSAATEVFFPPIPSHASTPSIQAAREILKYVQDLVRKNVLQSDLMRMEHLTKMGIINNMGSGTDTNAQQLEMMTSLTMAKQRAETRRQAATARQFRLPANASTTPGPVPPLPEK